MFDDNILFNGYMIDDATAARLVHMRNQYDYPGACMRYASSPTDFELAPGVYAEIVRPAAGEVTDLALDQYHATLLHSENSVDNLLGTLSTVYWGFYTFTDGLASGRATRHLKGYKTKPATTPAEIARILGNIKKAPDKGAALGLLNDVSQLGRTPFASKVIAFFDPARAGVLDNRLEDGLQKCRWARGAAFLGGIGQVSQPGKRNAYRAWCEFLCKIADRLNDGIAAGKPWLWQGKEASRQKWRAVDVERAIFRSFQKEGNGSVSRADDRSQA
ncbi:hypothetical protein [Cupriavidus taiwanensis]|uniref:Uncharacterized protein n=1 Tax=Cupriavidus taiwanensis TaxID=164546 RepID=A0A7Z7JFD0_9BURK|nr:hypothetical protein [Cupriavidus taiwanensis]SOZ17172.1 conserved hypothetical protein [Cupriavidus taiwanensis]SOZ96517.1 conserved hypothetical protein [Cupriavidus taiwanensis]SPC25555.1 conserved hypothetical protein [Cupriavidus taiwanensis]